MPDPTFPIFIKSLWKEIQENFLQAISFFLKNWRGLLITYLPFFIVALILDTAREVWWKYWLLQTSAFPGRESPVVRLFFAINPAISAIQNGILLLTLFYIYRRVQGFFPRLSFPFFRKVLGDFFLPSVVLYLISLFLLSVPSLPIYFLYTIGGLGFVKNYLDWLIWLVSFLLIYAIFPFIACLSFLLFVEAGYVFQTLKRIWAFGLKNYVFLLSFGFITGTVTRGIITGVELLMSILSGMFLTGLEIPWEGFAALKYHFFRIHRLIFLIYPGAPSAFPSYLGTFLANLLPFYRLPYPDATPPFTQTIPRLIGDFAEIPIFFIYSIMLCRIVLRRIGATTEYQRGNEPAEG